MRPRILLATAQLWPSAPRFAEALLASGAIVDILCPATHPWIVAWDEKHIHCYRGRLPHTSLSAAILAASPDVVIAGDDIVLAEILSLHRRRQLRHGVSDGIVRVIERSLGRPQIYPGLFERARFMRAAQEEEIRVPQTRTAFTSQSLLHGIRDLGLPCVLKTDGSTGGFGAAIVDGAENVVAARSDLSRKHIRATAGAFFRGQTSVRSLFSERIVPAVNLQEFVRGTPATTAFACWEGKVVGAVHAEVLQEYRSNGPATVVRTLANPVMDSNASKIASRFSLSGIHGLDYILEAATGFPILIEINPRLTQIAHFNLGEGRDPAIGIVAAISKTTPTPRSRVLKSDIVALFPQEWQRDPNSRFLSSGYHDVPWNDTTDFASRLGLSSDKFSPDNWPPKH